MINDEKIVLFNLRLAESGIKNSWAYNLSVELVQTLAAAIVVLCILGLSWIAVILLIVSFLAFFYRMWRISEIWPELCRVAQRPMLHDNAFLDVLRFVIHGRGDNPLTTFQNQYGRRLAGLHKDFQSTNESIVCAVSAQDKHHCEIRGVTWHDGSDIWGCVTRERWYHRLWRKLRGGNDE